MASRTQNLAVLIAMYGILFFPCLSAEAQSLASSENAAVELDALLRDYAHRALVRPRTGTVYTPDLPANLSDVKVSVVRLRSGSLRSRGLRSFGEFDVPPGFMAMPYTLRLALVYQNLGKLSSAAYHPLPGYTYLTPVIGLLAYDAMDLAAEKLPELDLVSSASPITIKFANLSASPPGSNCVYFYRNGSYHLGDLMPGNLCATNTLGHFAVVVNSTIFAPPPPPSQAQAPSGRMPAHPRKEVNKSYVWKIVLGVVGGFLAVVLLLFLLCWLRRNKQRGKMTDMVKQSDAGEVLKPQRVGSAQLPVASMVRTRPVLENEYVP